MKIAFDIDGCINDYLKHLTELLIKEYNIENVNQNTYNILEQIGISTLEEQKAFYKKHQSYFESKKPRKDSVEIINLLKEENDIFIITARNYDESIWTQNWLNKNGIKYDELLINTENKIGACKWKKIDVIVEDNPYNAVCLAEEGIKVLLFDNPYNQNIVHKNIKRCYSWNQIFENIKEMY